MTDTGLVYVGKIASLQPITGADFILSATVICGKGGKWQGVVKKDDFVLGDLCIVYLPDSVISEYYRDTMAFMASSSWRVKMRRFKGAPSEVLIMPNKAPTDLVNVGDDVTHVFNVTKYYKPVPPHLNGVAIGHFPDFIPKTDEPNYQRVPELIEALVGHPFYISEKCDGSSTTAYRYKGHFGVCSRNLELFQDAENGYIKVATKYKLEEKLPEGIALQWETCGPGIQSNPMGLKEINGFAFSGYHIEEKRYLEMDELVELCNKLRFPMCDWEDCGSYYDPFDIESLGHGVYENGKPREGVVVRSCKNLLGHKPISFKVINLDYEK